MEKSKVDNELHSLLAEIRVQTGNNAPGFTDFMSKLSALTDTYAIIELIPSLRAIISYGPAVRVLGAANIINVFLSPFQNVFNLINANETGLKFYAYRATAYTLTAWAYDQKIPTESSTVIRNTKIGMGHTYGGAIAYRSAWQKASASTLASIRKFCKEQSIPEEHLKIMLIATSSKEPYLLAQAILESYENRIQFVVRNIWKSGYSIRYPQ